MPAVVFFQNPAQPLKFRDTRPEVDDQPQSKKVCAPPDDKIALPGCKAEEPKASCGRYYCRYCDKKGDHITAKCPLDPDNDYDSDDEDPDIVEYSGEREGYSWTCLLGCGGDDCTFDHGFTRGLYVRKQCLTCHNSGHWYHECSIKPTCSEEELEGAAEMNMGEKSKVLEIQNQPSANPCC